VRSRPILWALAAVIVIVGLVLLVISLSSTNAKPGTHDVQVTPGKSVPFDLAHNARADVSAGTCSQTSGGWVLKGAVRNPGTKVTSFEIVVDFVSRPGATVLATTVVDVHNVASGARATWSAMGAQGDSHVACIVRLAQTT
jgi:hypothetical protein